MLIRRKVPIAIERYVLNGAILGLLALLYAPLLWHWVDGWLNKSISTEHEYFSHGLIGLPFAAYIAWNQRNEWRRLPEANHPLGIAFLSLGAVFYLSGLSDLVNLSLPAILVGLCLWLKGMPGLKLQGFPLILVFLATPTELPYLIAPYTLPLQHFIAAIAGFILNQFGMDVTVEQIYLYVGDRIVEVAPYCAGLKMLFTSLYVGLMLVYWTGTWTSRTKTSLFFLGTVVISVSANILRNTLLTFFHGTGQEKAFEWLHAGWGGDLYSACMLGLTVLLLTKIDQFFSSNPESDGAEGVAE
ncbi:MULTISPECIES: cyanoexosortase B [Trichocoleus]|uniref:Cyanoexosortase B n=1 Tax=Trichocoleus desertorum GB2-A4 TaxID=2933944 RepID=A0ABV0J3R3_9CYAN|nr:cyanoexosortase B [Trichocoleus sp. FACHB-46]MBD1861768.1 cyanoexosortase B [Trichocoleus sp. FACHB-46]